jgi:glycosyltransferase involved in cell wall biosynthesis
MKTKIAIVSAGVFPIPAIKGGAVETLVDYLIDKNEFYKELDITVFSIQDENIKQISKNCSYTSVIEVKYNKAYSRTNMIFQKVRNILQPKYEIKNLYINKVSKILKKNDYDYIVVENRPQFVIPISKVTNSKIILHLHNDTLNESTNNSKSIIDKCYQIFTVSNFIKSRVLSVKGINKDKVITFMNSVDIEKFSYDMTAQEKKKFKERFSISDDELVILYIGNLKPEKGIYELMKAFTEIEKDNISLLVVGGSWYSENADNPFTQKLKTLSGQSKNKITLSGYVNHSEIPQFHSIADIIVVPSVWEDPCPLVVFEALCSGAATIVTDSGGIPEIVERNNALIVERGPNLVDGLKLAMVELIENEKLRKQLSNNAKIHVQKYNIDDYYTRFLGLIEDAK